MRSLYYTVIILAFAFCGAITAFGYEFGERPYLAFGDSTKVLEPPHRRVNWTIIAILEDSSFVRLEVVDDNLVVFDAEGTVIKTHTVTPEMRAMFTSIDPMASDMAGYSPYAYCYGNPIGFADMDGLRPTAYESALMASAVYHDRENYSERIAALNGLNWVVSSVGGDLQLNHPAGTGIGLQSMVFEKSTDAGIEYAYVYAGTNSWEDCVEDLTQIVGITAQYSKAIENARAISTAVGENELTFVGHSMGGAEAAAASMATGRAAITFNPAAVSMGTRLLNGAYGRGDIVNYISSTPGIKGVHLPVDYVTRLQNKLGMFAPGTYKPVPVGIFPSHGIDEIVDALAPNNTPN
ncbi:MAG: hypothetical protein K2L16_03075 [Muribaculaceae bacterium]|nr:hypothetical protein [Muribaculaceae bacterium]